MNVATVKRGRHEMSAYDEIREQGQKEALVFGSTHRAEITGMRVMLILRSQAFDQRMQYRDSVAQHRGHLERLPHVEREKTLASLRERIIVEGPHGRHSLYDLRQREERTSRDER
jgi:hypothetical protein